MPSDDDEEKQLRSVALQNAQSILLARQRADRDTGISDGDSARSGTASLGRPTMGLSSENGWFFTQCGVGAGEQLCRRTGQGGCAWSRHQFRRSKR